ncbi:flavin-containing monooxygenase [Thalassolituus sp. UBA3500]|uniref:flavin-containing monooxygenase n=1 Tax=Thalassolituus sp. UBA3500 TaxID=1947664 RepID=UPI000C0CE087|nr:NAD(P)/FAD-dependent oxidoreductase [Thalassolituus sp. UBA3500]MBN58522.1 4-hydroxyacetophenone monooxygenase [Oceanospirillaceae bacterium]
MRSKALAKDTTSKDDISIAIIGSGFGGLGLAIQLKKAGINNFTIFEKASDVGGVWRDNTYPGAACDVPSHLYSFSFEQELGWNNRFGTADEIHGYLRHCADKYGIRQHIRFNTEIVSAEFDESDSVWMLRTAEGEVHGAMIMVAAVGQLNRPAYPDLKGSSVFAGKTFHSARWDHDYDLKGKRVAVVGTGASAIQFIPEILSQVAHIDVYQRSAPYVLPKPDKRYGRLKKALFRNFPLLQTLDRGWQYSYHELRQLGLNFRVNDSSIVDRVFRRHLRASVEDADLRSRLTPEYPIGCKRILISNHWYKALVDPKVEVVDKGIAEILPSSIKTCDGKEREVDAIIYGTGFAATDFLAPMKIAGLDGQLLKQAWAEGAEAYLGLTVSGFPNMFMLYGPNTNLGHNSIIYMLQSQIEYILDAVQKMKGANLRFLNLRKNVQDEFNREIQERMKSTVWAQGCTSWYQTDTGKNTNNWPGSTLEYRKRTRRLNLVHYAI